MAVPVERGEIVVGYQRIALVQQSVYRLGIQQGRVEGDKLVVYDADGILLATVEEFLLLVQFGYFGIDGNDGVGELELAGERVDEAVVADGYIAAGSGLEPSVAVAAEQNGAT